MPALAFPDRPDTPRPGPSSDSGSDGSPAAGPSVAVAVERFLASLPTATTRTSYARTLNRLTALAGPRPVPELAPDDYAAVMEHVHGAAAATWNRHLSALPEQRRSSPSTSKTSTPSSAAPRHPCHRRRRRELPDQLVAGDLRERAQLLLIATGTRGCARFQVGRRMASTAVS
ncbi:hypothetical protein MTP10_21295 [Nonomuraea sp. 3-1Str]|uniref:hypothetical protein n=1 Tax=Nonomuraea sp. 3-1Str TaxID=2929801 RepID=UPI0028675974|nr:hypothetical protein [Nonomuraea sp. 3-1Str]MDR8411256.1 hypothetical protein [Nonomuraea sp. 3-1Str]